MVGLYRNRIARFFFTFVILIALLSSSWTQVWQMLSIAPEVNVVEASTTTTFTTDGTWQAPAGVTSVIVELWGSGGGAGGGGTAKKDGGGGGAGGQYVIKTVSVVPLNNYNYVIGTGGVGGGSATDGGDGSQSTFDSTVVVAKGGDGGVRYSAGATAGQGSVTGGVGDTVYAGGNGGDGSGTYGGGGGSGAGSTGTGNNASTKTGGVAKSEYGGAGGDGNRFNSGDGTAGFIYGGGGGGGTQNSSGGDGAQGFIRLTYNLPPTFTVDTADSPDPVTLGNNVTFTATATEGDGESWYLAVCKTNSITAGSPPTCAASQTYCVSSSAVSSSSQNNCAWTSTGSGAQNWYSFACDNAGTNPSCSSVNTVNSPITVNAVVYSVTVTPEGTISYGTIGGSSSKSTIDTSDTQTATNDGSATENFNIKTSNAVGGTSWTIGASSGSNIFVHEFSTNSGGDWTKFVDAVSYQSLSSGVAVDGTVDFDLKVTTPTSSDNQEKTITVTVQAVAP